MPALPVALRKIDFPIPHPLVLAGVIQIIICAVNKRSSGGVPEFSYSSTDRLWRRKVAVREYPETTYCLC
jgi:hypothetical protein